MHLQTETWFLLNRINTIILHSQEHGLMKYFENMSKRTFKQKTSKMRSNMQNRDLMVAEVGGIEEILIAGVIYLIGILFSAIICFVEYISYPNHSKTTVCADIRP